MEQTGRQRITTIVAYVITGAWTISFIADLAVRAYEPPSSLTPLMLIVAGWCFSDGIVSRRLNSAKEELEP